ncbi:MAG: DNA repair protein RecN, partial [Pseudonocardiaceae bacterium]
LMVDKASYATGLNRSGVRELDRETRIGELARMLAGLDDTDTGRAHAEELLATAAADKRPRRRKAG